MPAGPGKYDDICTIARTIAQAHTAVVLIIGGNKGTGFSVQTEHPDRLRLAEALEVMAKEIRAVDAGQPAAAR